MPETEYTLNEYIKDVKAILNKEVNPEVFTKSIKPLALKLASTDAMQDAAYKVCDEEQGFGAHLLHEEDNHELGIFMFSWLPNRGTPPHNHETWAVVAVVDGEEQETFYQRHDDGSQKGYADVKKTGETIMRVGDVSVCMPKDIHGVWNNSDQVSVSLHTYGKHINYTGRSSFDIEANKEIPFVVTVEN